MAEPDKFFEEVQEGLALVHGIADLGFTPGEQRKVQFGNRGRRTDPQQDWHQENFEMASASGLPRLVLELHSHTKHGRRVVLYSLPQEDKFHFCTGSPVTGQEVLPLLEQYLQSVRAGRKYTGPKT